VAQQFDRICLPFAQASDDHSAHSTLLMATGLNYSKWDGLEVSDEDEDGDEDRAGLVQQHRELSEATDAQQKLRKLLNDTKAAQQSGKPLEPPEEVRDILAEPLWCDDPRNKDAHGIAHGNAEAASRRPKVSAHQPVALQVTDEPGGAEHAEIFSQPSASRAEDTMKKTSCSSKRRGFAEWDKLKLDESDDEEGKEEAAEVGRGGSGSGAGGGGEVVRAVARPPAEVKKLQQLMQLQEGLSKMRKDREDRHKQIAMRENRILQRDGPPAMHEERT